MTLAVAGRSSVMVSFVLCISVNWWATLPPSLGINNAYQQHTTSLLQPCFWTCYAQLHGSGSNNQPSPCRLWCIWELFTLLAFSLMGQRSNEYAPQLLAISDHGRLTCSCFEADPRTVCVNMAAEDCNGKQSGFVKVMVCLCVHIQMVYELSARHV